MKRTEHDAIKTPALPADEALLVADSTFAVMAVSPAMLSHFGLSAQMVCGRDIRDVLTHRGGSAVGPADDFRWSEKPVSWCAQLAGSESTEFEVTSWTLGVEPTLRIVCLGALDGSGDVAGSEHFDASMARDLVHDLNNMLTTIGGHVTLLQAHAQQDESIAKRAAKLTASVQWGRELLGKLSSLFKGL